MLLLALLLAGGALVAAAVIAGRPLDSRGIGAPRRRATFVRMRLFRDVSRAQARRRRFGQANALVPVLMGTEEPLPLADVDAEGTIALTAEELAEFDGRPVGPTERAPLYLSILGRIYDVTDGASFYGPGKSYHKVWAAATSARVARTAHGAPLRAQLVGRDASRAFCTGCLEPPCLISDLRELTPAQLREADKWVELYEHHDKYTLVGKLRDGLEVHARRRLPAAAPHQGLNGRHVRAQELDAEGREALDAWRQVQLDEAMYAEGTSRRRLFRPK